MESVLSAVHARHHIFHHGRILRSMINRYETVSVRGVIYLNRSSHIVILSRCALATIRVVESLVHIMTAGLHSTQWRSLVVSHLHSSA